jgi:hypothetical protein
MHPEIKKFWEDAGYKVDSHISQGEMVGLDNLMINKLWYAYKPEEGPLCVADISERKQYYHYPHLKKFLLSEKQMLKIIKLKAFI